MCQISKGKGLILLDFYLVLRSLFAFKTKHQNIKDNFTFFSVRSDLVYQDLVNPDDSQSEHIFGEKIFLVLFVLLNPVVSVSEIERGSGWAKTMQRSLEGEP